MDKTAIKNFAIEARKILMKSAITEAGFYGVTKDGCKSPVQKGSDFEVYETLAGTENRIFGDDIKRRANLVRAVEEQGFEQVIEETAYTWFNRIIAIRFMEVNNYLPTRVRVLSSEAGGGTPDIVAQADTVELNLMSEERDKIREAKKENRYDDAFRLLFIKQCNELNAILPGLFEKTDDYMELLLKISYTSDGVIRMLIDSIPEDNFNVVTEGQVEIIGWMYQYYNTELKDDTFAKLKKNVKITKERIPAATQLFTPDWIVRYMVENSLGRVWIEHLRAVNPSVDEKIKAKEFGWKYYLPEAEQEEDVATQLIEIRKSYKDLAPQDITCIDPCMGSGHILVYMFDVLMDIYRSEGFSEREAVFDILEKNIRGLDIDRRAYQLSYFALMMKARGYNRIFFRGHEDIDGNRVMATPKVFAIEESNSIERDQLKYYGADLDEMQKNNAINQMNGLLDELNDAKEYGSILNIDKYDWVLLRSFTEKICDGEQMSLIGFVARRSQKLLAKLIDIGETLASKYDAVVTNPPYMGSSGMGAKLSKYVKKEYPNSKSDLFAVFIEKCNSLSQKYCGMITQQAWMFLSSYEELRNRINTISSMAHLGARAFDDIGGEVVQTTSFVLNCSKLLGYKGSYLRLLNGNSEEEKEKLFFEKEKIICNDNKFKAIPGCPIAYWLKDCFIENFNKKNIGDTFIPKFGMSTGDGEKYIRNWYEINYEDFYRELHSIDEAETIDLKWVPLDKGGTFRKWYGNRNCAVWWKNNGADIKANPKSAVRSPQFFFKKHVSWTLVSSGHFSARMFDEGFVLDTASNCIYSNKDNFEYVIGFLNSKVADEYLSVLNPTMNFSCGVIALLPFNDENDDSVTNCVKDNISLAKDDWDSFETSWDFAEHPLVRLSRDLWDVTAIGASVHKYYGEHVKVSCPVELCFVLWQGECNERFSRIKENEEIINQSFIDLYGLNEELTSDVDDKEISVRKADLGREIRSLISYAIGCIFGRYTLNSDGINYAGGKFDINKYTEFEVDKDGIIPITDEAYFDDDIVNRFIDFIRTVYGSDSLEDNLDYIAKALGNKGTSSREIIRNYFLSDFYKDHCNTYSLTGSGKRPIYWLFDSGKQNGFKCLIYLHRYTPDTVGIIRSDYLTKAQNMIENALKNAEYTVNTSSSAVDRAQATKKRDKYIKQLAEIRAYYPALSHIALQRIDLDLDDGVKANYEKFQGIEISVEGEKKQKIDLLAKI